MTNNRIYAASCLLVLSSSFSINLLSANDSNIRCLGSTPTSKQNIDINII